MEQSAETLSVADIIKSLNEDKIKVDYDIEKFQSNEDLKKISKLNIELSLKFVEKKEKKVQKDVQTLLESNGDVKDKLTEMFSKFQKLVNLKM